VKSAEGINTVKKPLLRHRGFGSCEVQKSVYL
jgi:hypothetical protein